MKQNYNEAKTSFLVFGCAVVIGLYSIECIHMYIHMYVSGINMGCFNYNFIFLFSVVIKGSPNTFFFLENALKKSTEYLLKFLFFI